MYTLCAQDVAIATAITTNTLKVETKFSARFQDTYVAICDAFGTICVEMTQDAAEARIAQVRDRLA